MSNTELHKSQSQLQGQERRKIKCDFHVRDIAMIIRLQLQALYFSEAKMHTNTIKIYRPLKAVENTVL